MTLDGKRRPQDIAAATQNDQLDDEFIVQREIKGQGKGVRQTMLLIVGGNDETAVAPHDVRDSDRRLLTNEGVRSGQSLITDLASVITKLIADEHGTGEVAIVQSKAFVVS
ncbi:hypothetical protein [Bradyrhizobium genosp. P]|uniref:hypothetical protein n=1 Tax=Bradyrhizobium genosp. P TaxID=83641 RepID=UPI003CF9CD43